MILRLYYNKANKRYLIFTSSACGKVVVNKLVKTTPGEKLQIVVGSAGTNVTDAYETENFFDEAAISSQAGKDRGIGGLSYISRVETMISSTK